MHSTKQNWLNRNLIGFSIVSFFNDFSFEMATVLLPSLTLMLAGPAYAPYVLGIALGFSEAASSSIKLFSGWLSDRIVHHKLLLLIGYTATPVCIALLGTAQHVGQIILYRIVAWMGKGLREPPRDVWLSTITAQQDYGKAFGFQRAFDTLGATAGPVLVFFIIAFVPLRSIFFIAAIPSILGILTLFLLTKETVRHTRSLYADTPLLTQLKALPTPFIHFLVSRFIFGLGYFNVTLIILRAQELLFSTTQSQIIATSWTIGLYALFNVIRAISEYSVGTISDHRDRKKLLAYVGFGLFAVTSLMLTIPNSHFLWWLLVFSMAGVSIATVTTLEKAYTAELVSETIRGVGYGALEATKGMGQLISNLLIGITWGLGSAAFAFMYAACVGCIAMLFLLATLTIKFPAQSD